MLREYGKNLRSLAYSLDTMGNEAAVWDQSFQEVSNVRYGLAEYVNHQSGNLPTAISANEQLLSEAPQFELLTERVPYPGEFKIPYSNFEAAIQKGVVPELAKIFGRHVSDKKFSLQSAYSPMVHLTNCSGAGKTRAALELGKITNVLFFKFGGSNGLKESIVGKEIIAFFHRLEGRHRIEGMQMMNVIIMRILFMFGELYDAGRLKDKVLFADKVVRKYLLMILEEPVLGDEDFAVRVRTLLLSGLESLYVDVNMQLLFDSGSVTECFDVVNLAWTITPSRIVTMNEIESFVSDWLPRRRISLVDNLSDRSVKFYALGLPPLLIVMDEAHCLMQKLNAESEAKLHFYPKDVAITNPFAQRVYAKPPVDVFRVLRGTLRFFMFYWSSSLCITISTLAKLKHFNPKPINDPSYRPDFDFKLNNPIILWHTFDCYRVGVFNKKSVENWMDFLCSRERIIHVASCGRPLWGSHFAKAICDRFAAKAAASGEKKPFVEYLRECPSAFDVLGYTELTGAFAKLGNMVKKVAGEQFKFDCDVGAHEAVALLGLAVGVQKYPKEVSMFKMVKYGPFPVVGMDMQSFTIEAMACSEGIFNGTATLMLLNHLDDVADWLFRYVSTTDRSVFSQGEIGEIVDRISILKAVNTSSRKEWFDLARLRCPNFQAPIVPRMLIESILEPVGLESFLKEYVGPQATSKYLDVHPRLKGSFVAFSHFYYMGKDWVMENPYDAVANALSRGAAIVPRQGSWGLDALIPLVLSTGEISFIYIQVKLSAWSKQLPSATDVRASAPDARFHNMDVNRPYCYIFRKYNNTRTIQYIIHPSVAATTTPGNQACIGISGRVNANMPDKYQDLIRLYCLKKEFKFLEKNESLRSTWSLPGKLSDGNILARSRPLTTLMTAEEWERSNTVLDERSQTQRPASGQSSRASGTSSARSRGRRSSGGRGRGVGGGAVIRRRSGQIQ